MMSTLAFVLAVVCMLLLWSAVAIVALIAGAHQTPATHNDPTIPRRIRLRRWRASSAEDHTWSTAVDRLASGFEDATSTARSRT